MIVHVIARPYVVSFPATGSRYPLTSDDAQRLIDGYPVISATRNRVVLRSDDRQRCVIYPATAGGGPAFDITR
jgi:hypothetical protein